MIDPIYVAILVLLGVLLRFDGELLEADSFAGIIRQMRERGYPDDREPAHPARVGAAARSAVKRAGNTSRK